VELRQMEIERQARNERGPNEFWEEDFPEVK
jgi:hypothetical protein